jgi:hypothetical protein
MAGRIAALVTDGHYLADIAVKAGASSQRYEIPSLVAL